MNTTYFCVFCNRQTRRQYESAAELREHLIGAHLYAKPEVSSQCYKSLSQINYIDGWIKRYLRYMSALARSLSETVKALPSRNVDTLLRGCPLCDAIIDVFRLFVTTKSAALCVCGAGEELPLIAVKCCQCGQLYHWQCVVGSEYQGEELSLYVCVNCEQKSFEISELRAQSPNIQRVHCSHHLNYEPYVCKYKTDDSVCNQRFVTSFFLICHIKNCHNVSNVSAIRTQFCKYESIPQIEQLLKESYCYDQNSKSNQIKEESQKSANKCVPTVAPTIASHSGTHAMKKQTLPTAYRVLPTVKPKVTKQRKKLAKKKLTTNVQKKEKSSTFELIESSSDWESDREVCEHTFAKNRDKIIDRK